MAARRLKIPVAAACDLLGDFFTTLAHRTRMRIFCALQNGPSPVTAIAASAGISVANASQHLRLMRDKGAVLSEQRGQSVYYRIADRRFVDAASLIGQALADNLQSKAGNGRDLFSNRRGSAATFFKRLASANQVNTQNLKGVAL